MKSLNTNFDQLNANDSWIEIKKIFWNEFMTGEAETCFDVFEAILVN